MKNILSIALVIIGFNQLINASDLSAKNTNNNSTATKDNVFEGIAVGVEESTVSMVMKLRYQEEGCAVSTLSASGLMSSVLLGYYKKLFNTTIVGIELLLGLCNVKGYHSPGSETFNIKLKSANILNLKLGYKIYESLPYVKIGSAFTKLSYYCVNSQQQIESGSKTKCGLFGAIGIEIPVTSNITFNTEGSCIFIKNYQKAMFNGLISFKIKANVKAFKVGMKYYF